MYPRKESDVPGIKRFPKGEKKTTDKVASMKENSKLGHYGNNPVPENSDLTAYYKNPVGDLGTKRTIDESLDNGGMAEKRLGKENGIAQHVVGHLGTHKI